MIDVSGYSLFLPSGLLDYFDILKVDTSNVEILIYLEEKNNLSFDIASFYESKGFCNPVLVNDFPVRGKRLLLNIRRRRWIHKETGDYFSRDFSIVASGSRITHEFASFLKGAHR